MAQSDVFSDTGSHRFDENNCWDRLEIGILYAHSLPARRTGFIPRPGHRIFASGNRAGRYRWLAGFLGDLPFPPPLHSGTAPSSLQSPSSALKSSLLRAAQISSLTIIADIPMNFHGAMHAPDGTTGAKRLLNFGVRALYIKKAHKTARKDQIFSGLKVIYAEVTPRCIIHNLHDEEQSSERAVHCFNCVGKLNCSEGSRRDDVGRATFMFMSACVEVLQGKLVHTQCCTFSVHAAGASDHRAAWGNNVFRPLTSEQQGTHYTRPVASAAEQQLTPAYFAANDTDSYILSTNTKFGSSRLLPSRGFLKGRELHAILDSKQHSISYTLTRNQAIIVEYQKDENTDMFQVHIVRAYFIVNSRNVLFCKARCVPRMAGLPPTCDVRAIEGWGCRTKIDGSPPPSTSSSWLLGAQTVRCPTMGLGGTGGETLSATCIQVVHSRGAQTVRRPTMGLGGTGGETLSATCIQVVSLQGWGTLPFTLTPSPPYTSSSWLLGAQTVRCPTMGLGGTGGETLSATCIQVVSLQGLLDVRRWDWAEQGGKLSRRRAYKSCHCRGGVHSPSPSHPLPPYTSSSWLLGAQTVRCPTMGLGGTGGETLSATCIQVVSLQGWGTLPCTLTPSPPYTSICWLLGAQTVRRPTMGLGGTGGETLSATCIQVVSLQGWGTLPFTLKPSPPYTSSCWLLGAQTVRCPTMGLGGTGGETLSATCIQVVSLQGWGAQTVRRPTMGLGGTGGETLSATCIQVVSLQGWGTLPFTLTPSPPYTSSCWLLGAQTVRCPTMGLGGTGGETLSATCIQVVSLQGRFATIPYIRQLKATRNNPSHPTVEGDSQQSVVRRSFCPASFQTRDRARWRSGNTLDSHSGGLGFDSRNHSRRMLGWVPNKGHGRFLPNLPQSLFPVQLTPSLMTSLSTKQSALICPEESALTCPEESALTCPEESALTCPEESALTCPEESALTCREEIALTCPEEIALTCPEEIALTCPEEIALTCPEESALTCPEESALICPIHFNNRKGTDQTKNKKWCPVPIVQGEEGVGWLICSRRVVGSRPSSSACHVHVDWQLVSKSAQLEFANVTTTNYTFKKIRSRYAWSGGDPLGPPLPADTPPPGEARERLSELRHGATRELAKFLDDDVQPYEYCSGPVARYLGRSPRTESSNRDIGEEYGRRRTRELAKFLDDDVQPYEYCSGPVARYLGRSPRTESPRTSVKSTDDGGQGVSGREDVEPGDLVTSQELKQLSSKNRSLKLVYDILYIGQFRYLQPSLCQVIGAQPSLCQVIGAGRQVTPRPRLLTVEVVFECVTVRAQSLSTMTSRQETPQPPEILPDLIRVAQMEWDLTEDIVTLITNVLGVDAIHATKLQWGVRNINSDSINLPVWSPGDISLASAPSSYDRRASIAISLPRRRRASASALVVDASAAGVYRPRTSALSPSAPSSYDRRASIAISLPRRRRASASALVVDASAAGVYRPRTSALSPSAPSSYDRRASIAISLPRRRRASASALVVDASAAGVYRPRTSALSRSYRTLDSGTGQGFVKFQDTIFLFEQGRAQLSPIDSMRLAEKGRAPEVFPPSRSTPCLCYGYLSLLALPTSGRRICRPTTRHFQKHFSSDKSLVHIKNIGCEITSVLVGSIIYRVADNVATKDLERAKENFLTNCYISFPSVRRDPRQWDPISGSFLRALQSLPFSPLQFALILPHCRASGTLPRCHFTAPERHPPGDMPLFTLLLLLELFSVHDLGVLEIRDFSLFQAASRGNYRSNLLIDYVLRDCWENFLRNVVIPSPNCTNMMDYLVALATHCRLVQDGRAMSLVDRETGLQNGRTMCLVDTETGLQDDFWSTVRQAGRTTSGRSTGRQADRTMSSRLEGRLAGRCLWSTGRQGCRMAGRCVWSTRRQDCRTMSVVDSKAGWQDDVWSVDRKAGWQDDVWSTGRQAGRMMSLVDRKAGWQDDVSGRQGDRVAEWQDDVSGRLAGRRLVGRQEGRLTGRCLVDWKAGWQDDVSGRQGDRVAEWQDDVSGRHGDRIAGRCLWSTVRQAGRTTSGRSTGRQADRTMSGRQEGRMAGRCLVDRKAGWQDDVSGRQEGRLAGRCLWSTGRQAGRTMSGRQEGRMAGRCLVDRKAGWQDDVWSTGRQAGRTMSLVDRKAGWQDDVSGRQEGRLAGRCLWSTGRQAGRTMSLVDRKAGWQDDVWSTGRQDGRTMSGRQEGRLAGRCLVDRKAGWQDDVWSTGRQDGRTMSGRQEGRLAGRCLVDRKAGWQDDVSGRQEGRLAGRCLWSTGRQAGRTMSGRQEGRLAGRCLWSTGLQDDVSGRQEGTLPCRAGPVLLVVHSVVCILDVMSDTDKFIQLTEERPSIWDMSSKMIWTGTYRIKVGRTSRKKFHDLSFHLGASCSVIPSRVFLSLQPDIVCCWLPSRPPYWFSYLLSGASIGSSSRKFHCLQGAPSWFPHCLLVSACCHRLLGAWCRLDAKGDVPYADTRLYQRDMWVDYSPSTKVNRVLLPAGSLSNLACRNLTGRCLWSAGFVGDLPFPTTFHSGAAPYSPRFTLISSQEYVVKGEVFLPSWIFDFLCLVIDFHYKDVYEESKLKWAGPHRLLCDQAGSHQLQMGNRWVGGLKGKAAELKDLYCVLQIGRSSDAPIDFVVMDTVPGDKAKDSQNKVLQSTISRFACRIIAERKNPRVARIYAAGFDNGCNIFLGVSLLEAEEYPGSRTKQGFSKGVSKREWTISAVPDTGYED
ncbi:hypothetical protein PR048_024256 [Dryococelus australis]|uniref:Pellino FHA domain-containing protein n=1 Tax=Dryococelus australis TaxID=614101 RepID=A0ABQ9GN35_9NEOP|nr:hypothetical protein PR048_024256 [Dryococelus australis]